jgi:hypothetical protein
LRRAQGAISAGPLEASTKGHHCTTPSSRGCCRRELEAANGHSVDAGQIVTGVCIRAAPRRPVKSELSGDRWRLAPGIRSCRQRPSASPRLSAAAAFRTGDGFRRRRTLAAASGKQPAKGPRPELGSRRRPLCRRYHQSRRWSRSLVPPGGLGQVTVRVAHSRTRRSRMTHGHGHGVDRWARSDRCGPATAGLHSPWCALPCDWPALADGQTTTDRARSAPRGCAAQRHDAAPLRRRSELGAHRRQPRADPGAGSADRQGLRGGHALGVHVRRRRRRQGAARTAPLLLRAPASLRALRRPTRRQATPSGAARHGPLLRGRRLSLRAVQTG